MTKSRKLGFLAPLGLVFFLMSCGPQPQGPSSDVTPNPDNREEIGEDHATACGADFEGPDSDGDGLPDACAEALGFPIDNPDCDNDGTTNRFDSPAQCDDDPTNDDENCVGPACDERTESLFRDPDFWNGMNLAGSAFSNTAPPGSDIRIDKQILAFGSIGSDTINWREHFPEYAGLVTLRYDPECRKKNTIYFMANGIVNDQPALIELCGELKSGSEETNVILGTDEPFDSRESIQLDALNLALVEWTRGRVRNNYFNPRVARLRDMESSLNLNGKLFERKEICTESNQECQENGVVYDKLDLGMESSFSIEYRTLYYGYEGTELFTTTDVLETEWKRTGNLNEQRPYSMGLRGVWVNVCKSGFSNVFCAFGD